MRIEDVAKRKCHVKGKDLVIQQQKRTSRRFFFTSVNKYNLYIWGRLVRYLSSCGEIWTAYVISEEFFRTGIKTLSPQIPKQENPMDSGCNTFHYL